MRILYVGSYDIYSRHELGFIASLGVLGDVDVLALDREVNRVVLERVNIHSDNGVKRVNLMRIPLRAGIHRISYIAGLAKTIGEDIDEYDVIFATPREPVILSRLISSRDPDLPVVLRLWSIRASKLRDNLSHGAYEDILLFAPSIISNLIYMIISNVAIAIDNATFQYARRLYRIYSNRIYKIYPPYGYIVRDQESSERDQVVVDQVERIGEYVLGFTILSKKGPYLKFEAKPHALALYRIARRLRDVNVLVAGSSLEEWRRVFPGLPRPKNMFFVKGFTDRALSVIYKNAIIVATPISNKSISNRLLEALYHGKPVITTEVVKSIHPELVHNENIYISSWSQIDEDVSKLIRDEQTLRVLEKGAREAYMRYFSTRVNVISTMKIVESIKSP